MSATARPVRRPRWRAYLLLSRVSNVPTVWTNVAAGASAGGALAGVPASTLLLVMAGISLMYVAGMFLNDLADAGFDRQFRPDRPLPRGDVRTGEVAASGSALLLAGMLVAWLPRTAAGPGAWLVALGAAIVAYDAHHKQNPLSPFVMALCRALVYASAAAVAFGTVTVPVLIAALVLAAYVAGLTLVSKRLGPKGGAIVPWLLAGISVIDAGVVLATGGSVVAAGLCVAAVLATRLLQRVIPGD